MERLGLEEFDDWDFFYYLDGAKFSGPACHDEDKVCFRGTDPEPKEAYVEFTDYDGSKTRVQKEIYNSNFQVDVIGNIPDYRRSIGITPDELSLREAYRIAIEIIPKSWLWVIFVMDDD
jgi:hypothetical protein